MGENLGDLMIQLRWKDEDTIEGELEEIDVKHRMDLISEANSYMGGEPIFGGLVLFKKTLTYRDIPLEFVLYRYMDNETGKLNEEKRFEVGNDEISGGMMLHMHHREHELGRDSVLSTEVWNSWDREKKIEGWKDMRLKERVERSLEFVVFDIDWLLDRAVDDFRRLNEKDIKEMEDLIRKAKG